MRKNVISSMLYVCCFYGVPAFANEVYESCILSGVSSGDAVSIQVLKDECLEQASNVDDKVQLGAVSERILQERATQWNRFVITPHKRNYILPATYTDNINRDAYEFADNWSEELKHTEAKFQVSFKVPLNSKDIFREHDSLNFGFTLTSWWQVYASEISAPFRETNYQPEIFYFSKLDWHPLGGNMGWLLGFEHQSNGRAKPLSRSWNRVYTGLIYERDNYMLMARPWYRIREDAESDDNPDIERYMGHFELTGAYKMGSHELSFQGRNNLRSDNKGSIELGWSFPLYGHLKGYAQLFNGYGESLIDYNISQTRFGLGILLTDVL